MKQSDRRKALFESWVRDYGGDIYRGALRRCGDSNCAEELAQEVFFEAWRSMDSLRDSAKARVWLLSILRHRYMHWLRDEKRRPKASFDAGAKATLVSSGQDSPAELLARQESLQAALRDLDDRYKGPFLLVFLEGMTCKETAKFLDIPLGTVLSRIHRARQFLREHLESEGPQSGHLRIHREDRDLPRGDIGGAS